MIETQLVWPPVAEKIISDDEILQILQTRGEKLVSVEKKGNIQTDVWIIDGHNFEDFTESKIGQEVGRQREKIFRTVREGSGKERDLTKEIDNKYYHLLVTVPRTGKIIAGYRFTIGREKLEEFNGSTEGFYNASLFDFDDELKEEFFPNSMELTRLFGESPEKNLFDPRKPEIREYKYSNLSGEKGISRGQAMWEMISLFTGLHKLVHDKKIKYEIGSVTFGGYIPKDLLEMLLFCLQSSSAESGIKAGFTDNQVRAKNPENEIKISDEKQEVFRKIFPISNSLDENVDILKQIFIKRKIKFPEAIAPYTDVVGNEYMKWGIAVRNPDRSSGNENKDEQSIEIFLTINLEGITEARDKFYGDFSGISLLKKEVVEE